MIKRELEREREREREKSQLNPDWNRIESLGIKKETYERPVLHNYIDVVNPSDKTKTSGT